MTWASVILSGLKILSSVMTYLNERQLIQAAEDRQIAKAAAALLEMTEYGRLLRDRIRQMSPEETDDLWDRMTQ